MIGGWERDVKGGGTALLGGIREKKGGNDGLMFGNLRAVA